jgi:hypothetical protein
MMSYEWLWLLVQVSKKGGASKSGKKDGDASDDDDSPIDDETKHKVWLFQQGGPLFFHYNRISRSFIEWIPALCK